MKTIKRQPACTHPEGVCCVWCVSFEKPPLEDVMKAMEEEFKLMTKNNDATRALEIFTNAVDIDGWVYDEGKCNRSKGFSIMTPQQHKIICTALQKSAQVYELVDAVMEVVNDCAHYMPAPPWEITYKLNKALQQFSATEI